MGGKVLAAEQAEGVRCPPRDSLSKDTSTPTGPSFVMLSALGLTLLVTEVIGGAIDKTDSKTDPPTHLSMVLEIWFIFSKLYLFSYTYLV